MKNYSDGIFVEQKRKLKFPDYSNYTCVNGAYQDLITKFISVIDFVAPIKTLRVKFNTEPRFDINLLNASRNRKNHYKPFKRPGKETDKRNFKCEKLSKVIEK